VSRNAIDPVFSLEAGKTLPLTDYWATGMSATPQPTSFELESAAGGRLRGEQVGPGRALVLLHGLSATRRNVVQGSRYLARNGYRLIAFDARGHGSSDPAPAPGAYEYTDQVRDLEALLEQLGLERVVLVGSSMGAATSMAFALAQPDRVEALVQITPAFTGARTTAVALEVWERLAEALELGIEEFVATAVTDDVPERWREAARVATRQRLQRHRNLAAVADAVRVVPRSQAFEGLNPLETLELPTLVVGSRDEADLLHPLAVAREYAERLPRAELVVEADGQAPLAWRGAALSKEIASFLERASLQP
jgi:pimeloyl-ACP methyl ester carboxylesterase